jgi:FkbM family methyltransferase
MFLIREGAAGRPNAVFQELKNDAHSPAGGQMMFFPHDGGARYFSQMGIPEIGLIRWCKDNFMRADKVFVDIGAHVGTYSFMLAPFASHTWSFECTPRTFCCLAANIALHGLEDKVSLRHCALGEACGETTIVVRSGDGGGNGRALGDHRDDGCGRLVAELRTLDSFNINNIGLIKIDVEGFEKNVLAGALATLERCNYPPIVFEAWGAEADVFEFLSGLGYRYQKITGGDCMWLATHPKYGP